MRICKDCEIEFVEKKSKKGKFNQCDDCSQEDETHRYIGYNTGELNKMSCTGIYRGTSKTVISQLLKKGQQAS